MKNLKIKMARMELDMSQEELAKSWSDQTDHWVD